MGFIDLHCDTLMRLHALEKERMGLLLEKGRPGSTSETDKGDTETPWENTGQADLKRMLKSGYYAQCFACFTNQHSDPIRDSHYEDVLAMAELMKQTVREHKGELAFAGSFAEYRKNKEQGKLSVILTVEEGGILENDLERLKTLYDAGIRMITLTWNYENCIGYPNKDFTYQNCGLKPFGREMLEYMDELGIAADVSHMSDGGFEDVWKYGKRPFLATHSNARSVAGHPRNLTDEMLKKLADKGGVTGLNFYGPFVQGNGESTMEGLLAQVRHILKVAGRDVLCIGSDFDGMDGVQAIRGCQEMPKFAEAMEQAGFTEGEIEAVCWKNAEMFMERYFGS